MKVNQISLFYKLALGIIAVLCLLSFAALQHIIANQHDYASLINISGKQRMLSQRAGLLALDHITNTDNPLQKRITAQKLETVIQEMETAHLFLLHGDDGANNASLSPQMYEVYFGEGTELDQRVHQYLTTLRSVLTSTGASKADIIAVIRKAETDLLPVLDNVVSQYEVSSQNAIHTLKTFQFGVLVITLLVLVLEGRFIFRPILQSVTAYTEDLVKASQVKSDFLANMSHELRTPLNGILGLCDVMQDGKLNAEQRQNVKIIKQSGESLRALLNDILDISKIEAGGLEIETVNFSLEDSIQNVTKPLSTLSQKKGVIINVIGVEGCPHYLQGDQAKFEQILRNLVSNALKFTDRGSVTVDLSYDQKSETLETRVIDTGIGIPEEKLETIFEKFTQADTSTQRRYGGTGLGLCITKELVEMMGGSINLQSIVGLGTTFDIDLSMAPGIKPTHATDEHIDREADFSNLSLRVLAVDDHPVNLLLLKKMLLKVGIARPDIAENGLEALTLCQDNTYDLILMDCQMPEMDGYTATREIRKLENDKDHHTIIIAMTANAMVGDREKCLKSGMDDYLSKPITKDRFLQTVSPYLLHYKRDQKEILETQPDAIKANENTPIDMDHLNQFTDGNHDDEQEFFSLFLEQTTDVMNTLKHAMTANDNDQWKQAAHKLKGSSANLGAFRLSKICEQAQNLKSENADDRQQLFLQIKKELAQVEAFMQMRG